MGKIGVQSHILFPNLLGLSLLLVSTRTSPGHAQKGTPYLKGHSLCTYEKYKRLSIFGISQNYQSAAILVDTLNLTLKKFLTIKPIIYFWPISYTTNL